MRLKHNELVCSHTKCTPAVLIPSGFVAYDVINRRRAANHDLMVCTSYLNTSVTLTIHCFRHECQQSHFGVILNHTPTTHNIQKLTTTTDTQLRILWKRWKNTISFISRWELHPDAVFFVVQDGSDITSACKDDNIRAVLLIFSDTIQKDFKCIHDDVRASRTSSQHLHPGR